jgi:transglutaminase-like putative cysteine protease
MDGDHEGIMDLGLGRLAGLAAFVLMLLRLGRLIESGGDAPAWQLIMIAGAFLGGVIWWLLSQTLSSRRTAVVTFAVAGMVLFMRIAVPDTLAGGFLPTLETFPALGRELAQAMNIIRFAVAPVFPTSGIVAILSMLMWINGGLYIWGATSGPTAAMVLPSLALYLQFAVMDRIPAGRGWMGVAAIVIGLAIASVAVERRSDAGRVRDLEGRPLPRRSGPMAFVLAIFVAFGSLVLADRASPLVPSHGNIQWRVGSGYGPGVGGVSFDRLADLQQKLISRSNAVVFTATFGADAPPANRIYWRMESLDVFDGEGWRPGRAAPDFYQPGRAGGDPAHAYRGSTQTISQRVRIDALRQEVVPLAGIAERLESDNLNTSSFQIGTDGSVLYQAFLDQGDEYQAVATLARQDQDLGALASSNGELSPLFAAAAADGTFTASPGQPEGDISRPENIDSFLQLPEDLPAEIAAAAFRQTSGAQTDFERAWLLQHWFRDSGDFTYSTNVTTGSGSLDLENWLTDSTSQNYRIGYCQQFASAMGVLGRALGIPSRVVWGFTPGTVTTVNGQEIIEVRDNNAHAWVEMWMDGFGWVRFDPTPRGDGALPTSVTSGFDPVAYLPDPDVVAFPGQSANPFLGDDAPGFSDDAGTPGDGASTGDFTLWALVVPVVIVLIGFVPLLKSVRRRRRMGRLREGDITAAWEEIVDRLDDLGTPVPAHQTPLEFATATDRSLIPLARTYSAAVYGDINGLAREEDLESVERWLRMRYEGGKRTRAAFNPKSLYR